MIRKTIRRLEREAFLTTPLGIVVSPVYLIRDGLHRAIRSFAAEISGRVLDFGCGSKPYETLFERAASYTGVDIAVSGHDHRKSRIDVFYDGRTLPFADSTFDSAVCFEVFEHVFDIDHLLTELLRVLRPGGKLLLSIPFAWGEHEAPFDFARYTSFGINATLARNGFSVIAAVKTTTFVRALAQLFIDYLARLVLPQGDVVKRILQLILIFPLNLLAIAVDLVLPARYEYYCNSVVLVEKRPPAHL